MTVFRDELLSTREAVELAFYKSVPQPYESTKLYAAKVINVFNEPADDYTVELLTYNESYARIDVRIILDVADWVDMTFRFQEERNIHKVIKLEELLNRQRGVTRTEIKRGVWLNFGADETIWVRVYMRSGAELDNITRTFDIDMNIAIGNSSLPSRRKVFGPKLKHAGIPLYEWFYIRNAEWNSGKYTVDIKDIEILHNSNELPIMYTQLVYDIEVYNNNILFSSHMPDILDNNSIINCISMCYYHETKLIKTISVAYSPFVLPMKDVIFVKTEKDLLEVFIHILLITRPLYIVDFNGGTFDMKWILHRIQTRQLSRFFCENFNIKMPYGKTLPEYMTQTLKSLVPGKMKNGSKDLSYGIKTRDMNHLDLMYYVVDTKAFDKKLGRSLNAIAEYHGLGEKDKVQHWRMSLMFYAAARLDNIEKLMNDIRLSSQSNIIKQTVWDFEEIKALNVGDIKTFFDIFKEYFQKYIEYCVQDVKLCKDISDKINMIGNLHGMAKIYSTDAYTIIYRGVSTKVRSFAETYMIPNNYTFHRLSDVERSQWNGIDGDVEKLGGITIEVFPEESQQRTKLFVTFDLSSAYPRAMVDMNISRETLVIPRKNKNGNMIIPPNCVRFDFPTDSGQIKTFFVRQDKVGLMSKLESLLIAHRNIEKQILKDMIKADAPSYMIKTVTVREYALKIMSVSLYGQTGSDYNIDSWMKSNAMSSMITTTTAVMMKLLMIRMFLKYGMVTIIGVTDSVGFEIDPAWLSLFGISHEDKQSLYDLSKKLAPLIEAELNQMIKEFLGPDCTSFICTEYFGMPLVIHQMKRYATVRLNTKKDTLDKAHSTGKPKFVGFTLIRTNASKGIVELSEMILKRLLDYRGLNEMAIIQEVLEYFGRRDNEHKRWAGFEGCSEDRDCMMTFREHARILSMLGHGFKLPPMIKERVYVVIVDYQCRCINLDGSAAGDWNVGMLYMDVDDAKDKNMPVNRRFLFDKVEKTCNEIIGPDSVITQTIKSRIHEEYNLKKENLMSKPKRIEWLTWLSNKLDFDKLTYLRISDFKSYTTCEQTLITRHLNRINTDIISDEYLTVSINKIKRELTRSLPKLCAGMKTRLTIHLSILCKQEIEYAESSQLKHELPILSVELKKIDKAITDILCQIG